MKFTKNIIEKMELPESGQRLIWDDELKGFGLRLTPTSRAYIVQARVNGVDRRVTIGRHGVLTLQEARKKAKVELVSMLEGKDPVIEKKRSEAYSLTLRKIADNYIRDRKLKETSKNDINKHIDKSFAAWAEKPAIEITRDKVAVRFRELSEKSNAQANQAFRILRAILNYARAAYRPDDKPLLIENPVSILSETKVWNRVQARSGRIPMNKIGLAWNIIKLIRESEGETIISHTLSDAIAFLLLSGARWSEMAELTWNRVNLTERWWNIPDPKNRQSVIFPLSKVTAKILEARSKDSPYIFPARTGEGHIHDARGHLEKLSEAVGVHVSAHDLRRTFRAIAGECQIELWKIKLLMNHKLSGDVTISHYTETQDLRYLDQEINKISDWIVQQGLIAASKKVVPFPSKAVN